MRQQPKCGHLIFHIRCKGCKALQASCYRELQTSDFEEIEDVTSPNEYLKAWHSIRFAIQDPIQREWVRRYFEAASDLLNQHCFDRPIERFIWALHCEGKSSRETEAVLAKSRFKKKYKHKSILDIINKIAVNMDFRDE